MFDGFTARSTIVSAFVCATTAGCFAPTSSAAGVDAPAGKSGDATQAWGNPGEAHGVFACTLGGNSANPNIAWDAEGSPEHVVYTVHRRSAAPPFWIVTQPPVGTPDGLTHLKQKPLILHGSAFRPGIDYPAPGNAELVVFRQNGDIEFPNPPGGWTAASNEAKRRLTTRFDHATTIFLGQWFGYWGVWTDADRQERVALVQDGDDSFVAVRNILWAKQTSAQSRRTEAFTQIAGMPEAEVVAMLESGEPADADKDEAVVWTASLESGEAPSRPTTQQAEKVDASEAFCDVVQNYEGLVQAMHVLEILAAVRKQWFPGTPGLNDGLSWGHREVLTTMVHHLAQLQGPDWKNPTLVVDALTERGCPASPRLKMRRCPADLHDWFQVNKSWLGLDL